MISSLLEADLEVSGEVFVFWLLGGFGGLLGQ